jgi:hypothetical protein
MLSMAFLLKKMSRPEMVNTFSGHNCNTKKGPLNNQCPLFFNCLSRSLSRTNPLVYTLRLSANLLMTLSNLGLTTN